MDNNSDSNRSSNDHRHPRAALLTATKGWGILTAHVYKGWKHGTRVCVRAIPTEGATRYCTCSLLPYCCYQMQGTQAAKGLASGGAASHASLPELHHWVKVKVVERRDSTLVLLSCRPRHAHTHPHANNNFLKMKAASNQHVSFFFLYPDFSSQRCLHLYNPSV